VVLEQVSHPLGHATIIIIIYLLNQHKHSCTATQHSGAGPQGPRKDTDSCPKKKHDMTAMHFTINQYYK